MSESRRTKLPLVLWIGTAAFIVYGTTIPFHFVSSQGAALAHWARVVWNPFISPETRHRISIPDFVSNILLFTPFGCFGVWALRRPRSRIAKILLLVFLSALLSATVEVAQLFTVDRISSIADVLANTLGGFSGAVAGVVLSASAATLIANAAAAGLAEATAFFPLVVATSVLFAGAWEPFDVTLDIGSLFPKIHLFLHDPVQFTMFGDEVVSLLQHLLFAAALIVWLKQIRVRSSLKTAAAIGIVITVGCEGAQLFIAARMPGLWDAAVGAAGVLVGLAAGVDFWRSRRAPTPERWCAGLFALTAIGVVLQQLSPFQIVRGAEIRPFQWMPFLNYYAFTTGETVSHSAELLLSYLPLGFGLAIAVRPRLARFATVTGLALLIAAPVEFLQRFIGGRYPDVTDIGMSVAGAWLGMWIGTRGWQLFNEQIALLNRQRVLSSAPSVR
ncbi:MAG TPA: VanZ family protein [Vicinamibacterales bacterium]|nr:VanZ family protein [Vicinamibacterales bacterium]